jgi:hypothetical protein
LSDVQVELFRQMSPSDQHHAVAVLGALQNRGPVDKALAQAALLHDVGKVGGGILVRHRVLTVLLEAISPGLLRRIALDKPSSWRYPFYVQLGHADRGASMATHVGVEEEAVRLICYHHSMLTESQLSRREQEQLASLQAADGVH